MVYHGKYIKGVIVLDETVDIAEGQAVQVLVGQASSPSTDSESPTVWQELLKLSGTVKGGPPDASRNHDHYLYGAPKRNPET